MIFSSPLFIFLFLPIVLVIYWLINNKFRRLFLLVVSLFYYAWGGGEYLVLLMLSIFVNYGFGLAIGYFRRPFSCLVMDFHAKLVLYLSIAVNLSILFFSKQVTHFILSLLPASINIQAIPEHAPIGVSFITFCAMAYVFDIYLQKNKAQLNFINFGLFIALFPKVTAGPIVRYSDIERDLINPSVSFKNVAYGVKRFIIGLGKKVLLADILAKTVQQIMEIPQEHLTTRLAWLGIISYTLQIYLDFSGYSDMAIGLGRMFGFHIMENFNYPYISKSITEFWRRWHISLSNWLRDYLYIPLGGNRISTGRTYLNLFIVFILCGLWHGRTQNFIIWGAFHGLFLILERWKLRKILNNLPAFIQHGYALLVIVFSWVIFRMESIRSTTRYFKALLGSAKGTGIQYSLMMYLNSELLFTLAIGVLCATPILQTIKQYADKRLIERNANRQISSIFAVSEALSLIVIFSLSLITLASFTHNPFIYFKF